MKTLKLQVGKIYRSREGEEVKIVRKNNKNVFPYQGSNGRWYAENGKWGYFPNEHPEDLIEEVEGIPESARILEWVEKHLDDGYYTQDNIAEVIETYLNCREGEK
jgi:hypothetical protein